MIVVVMGVAGSGKTTVGELLARTRGWTFIDGDDHHRASSVAKMRAGVPLDDGDRDPWIDDLAEMIRRTETRHTPAVFACSALRASHRERLRAGGNVRFVYLRIDHETAFRRLQHRPGHFMPSGLVGSQFATLEEPCDALTLDGTEAPTMIVDRIEEWLCLLVDSHADTVLETREVVPHGPEEPR